MQCLLTVDDTFWRNTMYSILLIYGSVIYEVYSLNATVYHKALTVDGLLHTTRYIYEEIPLHAIY